MSSIKMMRVLAWVTLASVVGSCASTSQNKRTFIISLGGASAGAIAGAGLSPNSESRLLNGVVFGLSGALIAGAAALIWGQDRVNESEISSPLKEHELSLGSELGERSYQVQPEGELPEFLKKRLRPVVIEEFLERDRFSDEGTLHEPHRVYRIKRPAELVPGESSSQSHPVEVTP